MSDSDCLEEMIIKELEKGEEIQSDTTLDVHTEYAKELMRDLGNVAREFTDLFFDRIVRGPFDAIDIERARAAAHSVFSVFSQD